MRIIFKTKSVFTGLRLRSSEGSKYSYRINFSERERIIAGSFRVSLFIDLGCPGDFGKGWRGDLDTFMISRPI